ncbi:Uma2 family endonuclease [Cryptosporangium phraense]|uniref:Uma2 family endonuclease n=2 Tax=Cryptosporangium phraense TaxID=2593070 RepID=A0A545ASR8_9ACTN|nr:Uma2 family endonuclease [Cryptosporangium phraense]
MHIPQGAWTADDLDRVPEEVGRCEVLDGVLIVMAPQRDFHSAVMWRLAAALDGSAPEGWRIRTEMTVRLGGKSRPEPDLVAVAPSAVLGPQRTWYLPTEVPLVVEIVSPDSEHRDRVAKHLKYARAGIPHYWRIEEDRGEAVVHAFELDAAAGYYVETAVERRKLVLERPFPMTIDVDRLYP